MSAAASYVHNKSHRHVLFCVLFLPVLLIGCAPTRSTVVLLPDTEGRVGAIDVASRQGRVRVDDAYQSVVMPNRESGKPTMTPVARKAFERQFAEALAAQPVRDFRFDVFRLYFHKDSIQLTEASLRIIDALVARFHNPAVQDIYVVGHADRLASNDYNRRLSCRRASSVRDRLIGAGIAHHLLTLTCLGETEPQVQTADEIGEPLNRRVKIVVKSAAAN